MKRAALLALALPLAWPWADRLVRGSDNPGSADAIVVLAGGRYTTGRLEAGLAWFQAGRDEAKGSEQNVRRCIRERLL
jgi:hypothetical protein